jgi:cell division initiation protein
MKITPIEIRQKVFQKKSFNGIDKDEVQTFLTDVSVAFEKMQDEMVDLRKQLDASEQERQKLKGVESSLYKTLKAAEDTSTSIIAEAKNEAEQIQQAAIAKADTLLSDAKLEAKNIIDQAEAHSRTFVTDLKKEMQTLEQDLRRLEAQRNTLLADIKKTATELLKKAEAASAKIETVEFPNLDFPESSPEAIRIKNGELKETDSNDSLKMTPQDQAEVEEDDHVEKNDSYEWIVDETEVKEEIVIEEIEVEVEITSDKTETKTAQEEAIQENKSKNKPAKQGSFFDNI